MTGLILTSPRAVQAVETVLSSPDFPTASSSSFSSSSSMVDVLRLPIFIVGGATQKLSQERLSPFVACASHLVSPSSSTPCSPEISASSASPSSLRLLGADSGNAKNLAEFIITHFQDEMNVGKGENWSVCLLLQSSFFFFCLFSPKCSFFLHLFAIIGLFYFFPCFFSD